MKRVLIVAAICAVAAPALASPELLPVMGKNYAVYNVVTKDVTPTPGPVRYGDPVWSSTNDSGWYFGSYNYGWTVLDWGDVGTPGVGVYIDGWQFAYATSVYGGAGTLDCVMLFLANENGFNSADKQFLAGFIVEDLPGRGADYNAWIVTVDLEGTGYEFTIDGPDLDSDNLVDFGYTYWFLNIPTSATGPLISGDTNTVNNPPGCEDAFDAYLDPNLPPASYGGTWWFGGDPFAQFYLELYEGNAANQPQPGCENPGGSGNYCTADVECGTHPCDCIVNLADLSYLLADYGCTSGCGAADLDGDGDVDLADLSAMLQQYGDNCN